MDAIEKKTAVNELIACLGGRAAVAKEIGIGYTAISNWCAWGFFPERHYRRLSRLSAAHGIEINDALFERPAVDGRHETSSEIETFPGGNAA